MFEVEIFDTTARDGHQTQGCAQSPQDKVAIAKQLAVMGVRVMEAGFPVASDDNFEAVKRVANEVPEITCCALARCDERDIKRAAEALRGAPNGRIHIFIATSEVHMRHKLKLEPEQVIERAISSTVLALSMGHQVEFSCEDASRSDAEFLSAIIAEVALVSHRDAHVRVINLPDTVGYALPENYGEMFADIIARVPAIRELEIILSAHCHNDLGLAVANSIAAVKAGARQVECTIRGIGERAGNTQLEAVVMALKIHSDVLGVSVNIDTKQLGPTARLLSAIIAQPLPPNLPIVGSNVFAHGSGIHQHGVLADKSTYEIMQPDDVGWDGKSLPLIAQSGRAGLNQRLKEIGYELGKEELTDLYGRFTKLADAKPEVFNEDLHMLMQEMRLERAASREHLLVLENVEYHKIRGERSVTVTLSRNGDAFEGSGSGNGPVSAVWGALRTILHRENLLPEELSLEQFDVGKGPGGVEALGLASVEIRCGDQFAFGRGSDTDIIVAYAQAEVNAINHLLHSPLSREAVKTI